MVHAHRQTLINNMYIDDLSVMLSFFESSRSKDCK
jgi:hypothetical protein